jgi:hypothetical protein
MAQSVFGTITQLAWALASECTGSITQENMTMAIYHPNAQDAMSVYLTAAAHQYNLPLDALDQPRHLLVQEGERYSGERAFRIVNPNDHTADGKLMPAVADCTYIYGTQLWEVEIWEQHLQGGAPLLVRSTDEGFVVVTDEE